MRAILLLVLGAALVWFVWRGIGPGQAEAEETHAAAPGAMIVVESESAAADVVDRGPPVPAAGPESTPPRSEDRVSNVALDLPAAQVEASKDGPATASELGTSDATPAEIAAAEELLHDPAKLGSWLAARGVDLPEGRRDYAASLVHAFAGHAGEASAALDRAAQTGALRPSERQLAERVAADGPNVERIAEESVLARAASMKATEREGLEHLAAGRAREAAACFSRLLLAEIVSPWKADASRLASWSDRLREAQQGNRWNRRGSWRSSEIVVQPGDSLIAIRKRAVAADPSLQVCTGQIARANQLEGEVIHPGAKLRIPLDPVSVLVDVDAHWALYMAGSEVVAAWQVGVGKESGSTRLGTFTVGEKSEEPMWFPQGRKPVPYGDPENPLGTRWIAWNDGDGNATRLGFHGTNEPESIGKDASLGCIRMRTGDIEELFDILPRGATIRVVP